MAGKEELLHEHVQFGHIQRPLALHLGVDQGRQHVLLRLMLARRDEGLGIAAEGGFGLG